MHQRCVQSKMKSSLSSVDELSHATFFYNLIEREHLTLREFAHL